MPEINRIALEFANLLRSDNLKRDQKYANKSLKLQKKKKNNSHAAWG
jgi:hypothetical protein